MARVIEDPLERRVATFLRRERLLTGRDPVVIAFSGGADSLALLACLTSLWSQGAISASVVAAHFDHGLRAGSRRDAEGARALAGSLGAPFHGGRARGLAASKGSMEAAARTARYRFLERALRAVGGTQIATAHTRDDRVETVLHRVLQGGNLGGLAGIPLRRPLRSGVAMEVVRPFHEVARRDIDAYLERRRLVPIMDPTNATGMNARARLRREVLPVLRAVYPGCDRALLHLEETAREARDASEFAPPPRQGEAADPPRSDFTGRGLEKLRSRVEALLGSLQGGSVAIPRAGLMRLRDAVGAADGRSRVVPLGRGWEAVVGPQRIAFRRTRESN
jgi:tRNA(Ile)-lysidine synthase